MKWFTTKEYAEFRKVSVSLIRKYIGQGKITKASLKKNGRRWLINHEKAENDLMGNLDNRFKNMEDISNEEKMKVIEKAGLKDMSLSELNKLDRFYQGELKRLEYEEKIGKLIDAEQVEKEAFATGRKIRDALLNIPSRISAIVSAETDAIKIEDMLTEEINRALVALSKGV